MQYPSHMFISDVDGAMYDTRQKDWSKRRPLRDTYCRHFREITTTDKLRATLRAGEFTQLGCYRLAFVTHDGELLSFGAVRQNLATVLDSIANEHRDGWRVIGLAGAHECDHEGICAHTGEVLWDND
jgi:hypothetical protein